jgi:hypothetical protein
MKKIILLAASFFSCSLLYCAANDEQEHYPLNIGTFQGHSITPETLVKLAAQASPLPEDLKKKIERLVETHQDLFTALTAIPKVDPLARIDDKKEVSDLQRAAIKEQFANAMLILNRLKKEKKVESLGAVHAVLRFKDIPDFIFHINRIGSRNAYQIFASDQGNVLDKDFHEKKFPHIDWSKAARVRPLQDASKMAHYLRFLEIAKLRSFKYFNLPQTFLYHIPGRPEELSDENYLVVQRWIPDIIKFKTGDKDETSNQFKNKQELEKARRAIPDKALTEMHTAIVYAALWNHLNKNLAKDPSGAYHFINMQGTIFHTPDFFFYQGKMGEKRFLEDVIGGLERMVYGRTQDQPATESEDEGLKDEHQIELWKKLTRNNAELMSLFKKYNIMPRYLHEDQQKTKPKEPQESN